MSQTAATRPLLSAVATANPLARMVGRDEPAWAVLASAASRLAPVVASFDAASGSGAAGDYAQIDAALAVVAGQELEEPAAGVGYSGLSAAQRWAFLNWLRTPTEAAPRAFQWLYLANLEVRLLEPNPWPILARDELLRLAQAPAWDASLVTPRLLLAFWLMQDGAGLAQWLASAPRQDGATMDKALGMLGRLARPLTAAVLPAVLAAWQIPAPNAAGGVLELRLSSLATTLGADPLQHALGPALAAPTFAPWRCLHRDLRIAIPQDRVRAIVEPLLTDMLTETMLPPVAAPGNELAPTATPANGNGDLEKAYLILEFRQSRSEYFAWALRKAQKQAGFQQLMDEDRHIVYRAPFRRSEQRRFWDLWDTVQSWSSTRLYCQGRELEKWQIYSGSPHMR